MTHDPLCPYRPERRTTCDHFGGPNSLGSGFSCAVLHYSPEVPCQCELIAKTRADEQAQPKTLNITGPVTINCARGNNTPEFNSYDVGA